eukprot:8110260-Alexandrium_andersonii.AAC.1
MSYVSVWYSCGCNDCTVSNMSMRYCIVPVAARCRMCSCGAGRDPGTAQRRACLCGTCPAPRAAQGR